MNPGSGSIATAAGGSSLGSRPPLEAFGAQRGSAYFAGVVSQRLARVFDCSGEFVGGEVSGEEGEDFFGGDGVGVGLDDGMDGVAEVVVGESDDGAGLHGGMVL